MNEIHEKLRKLLALAQQGVGGEKTNARMTLEKLMRKHGVEMEDLMEDSRTICWFKKPKDALESKLLKQTAYSVTGERESYIDPTRKNVIGFKATASENLEINLRYPLYVEALRKETEIFYTAFIHTNDIFHATSRTTGESSRSEEELTRIGLAMLGMSKVKIHRTLGNSGDTCPSPKTA